MGLLRSARSFKDSEKSGAIEFRFDTFISDDGDRERIYFNTIQVLFYINVEVE